MHQCHFNYTFNAPKISTICEGEFVTLNRSNKFYSRPSYDGPFQYADTQEWTASEGDPIFIIIGSCYISENEAITNWCHLNGSTAHYPAVKWIPTRRYASFLPAKSFPFMHFPSQLAPQFPNPHTSFLATRQRHNRSFDGALSGVNTVLQGWSNPPWVVSFVNLLSSAGAV